MRHRAGCRRGRCDLLDLLQQPWVVLLAERLILRVAVVAEAVPTCLEAAEGVVVEVEEEACCRRCYSV